MCSKQMMISEKKAPLITARVLLKQLFINQEALNFALVKRGSSNSFNFLLLKSSKGGFQLIVEGKFAFALILSHHTL